MKTIKVAMVSKLMPYYRLGIFQELSAIKGKYEFSFFGDTKEQAGIKQIPYSFASELEGSKIRWIKTKNYFYKPEGLLWQTGIIREIFRSSFKVFVFEGGIRHYPIWLFALLCKFRGKKVIYWTHGNKGLDKGIKKFLRVIFFKWLGDALFLYGNTQKNIMKNDGYDANRLFVIYNSLQPQKQFEIFDRLKSKDFTVEKAKLFKNPNEFTLIFIGRLAEGKGVLDILKLINSCKESSIIVNCIFIGEGQEENKMIEYSKENKLTDQIYFAGALYGEEIIAPYFMMADLMLSPGNVGLNCMHSLGYGVPVLTHNDFRYQNPEVEAIENNVTGIFYEYNNFDDMVSKLKYWIATSPPKEINQKNCQQVIQEIYNPTYQAKCIVSGLNKIFNEK